MTSGPTSDRGRTPPTAAVQFEFAAVTDVGMKRTHNEDNFSIVADQGLAIVADGMGGHASGEVASQMAVDTLKDFYTSTARDPDATWPYKLDKHRGYEENRIITGIRLANLRIHEAAQKDQKQRGMGTTIVSVIGTPEGIYVAHVGDSRVYRVRDGGIEQMTEDHSLLNDYMKMRKLTDEEIANFPHKNVIVRALGMKDQVKVDTRLEAPRAGDTYLLCSDGLSGPVTEQDMLRIVSDNESDLTAACRALIARANENGGPDNITACLARVLAS